MSLLRLTQDGHAGRVYEVTGPRLLAFADAVGEIAAAAGREIRYVPITAEQFATGMLEQGVPRDFAVALAELMVTVLDGPQFVGDRRRPSRDPGGLRPT